MDTSKRKGVGFRFVLSADATPKVHLIDKNSDGDVAVQKRAQKETADEEEQLSKFFFFLMLWWTLPGSLGGLPGFGELLTTPLHAILLIPLFPWMRPACLILARRITRKGQAAAAILTDSIMRNSAIVIGTGAATIVADDEHLDLTPSAIDRRLLVMRQLSE